MLEPGKIKKITYKQKIGVPFFDDKEELIIVFGEGKLIRAKKICFRGQQKEENGEEEISEALEKKCYEAIASFLNQEDLRLEVPIDDTSGVLTITFSDGKEEEFDRGLCNDDEDLEDILDEYLNLYEDEED